MRNWLFSFSLTFLQSHGHSRCHFLFFFLTPRIYSIYNSVGISKQRFQYEDASNVLRPHYAERKPLLTIARFRMVHAWTTLAWRPCLAFSCETFARNYIFLAAFFRLIISCTRIATFSPFISKRNYRNFVKISEKLSDKWNRRIKTNYKKRNVKVSIFASCFFDNEYLVN